MFAKFRFQHLMALIAGVVLFSPVSVFAQTGHAVIPDRQADSTIASVADGDTIEVAVEAGASYCCEVIVPSNSNIYFSSSTVTIAHGSGTTTASGAFPSSAPRLPNGQARLCFIVPEALTLPTATMTIGISSGSPLSNVPAQCFETTLYGGFNTSVTDFNFLEISNQSTSDITGSISAINVVPTPDVTVISQQAVTVEAGSRTDVDIHSAAGTGAFGPLKLVHLGAPGAVKAVLSQYNITSTAPLDFAPVAQDVMKTRSELAGPTK